jgi:hypothetical protein
VFRELHRYTRGQHVLVIDQIDPDANETAVTVRARSGKENRLTTVAEHTFVDLAAASHWIDRYAALVQRHGWHPSS